MKLFLKWLFEIVVGLFAFLVMGVVLISPVMLMDRVISSSFWPGLAAAVTFGYVLHKIGEWILNK